MERARRKQSKPVRFSPSPPPRRQLSRQRTKRSTGREDPVYGDMLSDGSIFLCEKCGSTFLDSRSRGVRKTMNTVYPAVRYSQSGEQLLYCKACGMEHDQHHVSSTVAKGHLLSKDSNVPQPSSSKDMDEFTTTLAAKTEMPEASKLTCYNPSKRCHCLTNYLMSISPEDLSTEVRSLLIISSKAAELKNLKVDNQLIGSQSRKVGRGNGKKRSKIYENYVLTERRKLRDNLNLCEHTAQKLLQYSNNFLHKRLLTEQKRTRIGEKPCSKLRPVTLLWKHQCCRDNCTRMTRTHLNLVAKWRQLSVESRRGLQQAVAELLTPTAGAKMNCYKFIAMVTGCSTATIAKVTKKIRRNGGVLGMHEHGLIKYWRTKREMMEQTDESSDEELPNVWTLPQHHADEVELRQTLDKKDKQLEGLRNQIAEQQKQIDQQKTELSSIIKKQSVNNSLMRPSTQSSWRSGGQQGSDGEPNTLNESSINWSANSRPIRDAGLSSVSPQYPHRQLPAFYSTGISQTAASHTSITTKPLLQPSKLDTTLMLREVTKSQSHSYVVATDRAPPPSTLVDQRQATLQEMQYLYNSSHDIVAGQGRSMSDPIASNFLFNPHLPSSDHFGAINPSYTFSTNHNLFNNDLISQSHHLKPGHLASNIGADVIAAQQTMASDHYYNQQTIVNHANHSWGYPVNDLLHDALRLEPSLHKE